MSDKDKCKKTKNLKLIKNNFLINEIFSSITTDEFKIAQQLLKDECWEYVPDKYSEFDDNFKFSDGTTGFYWVEFWAKADIRDIDIIIKNGEIFNKFVHKDNKGNIVCERYYLDLIHLTNACFFNNNPHAISYLINFYRDYLLKNCPNILIEDIVNMSDCFGDTPLHFAVKNTNPLVASLLLSLGADIDAVNTSGQTPLALAQNWDSNIDIISILLNAGAKSC